MKIFALIDSANTPDFFEVLAQYDPPASCLYNHPIQEEMKLIAPYLIEATEPIKGWLATKTSTAWGLYLLTEPEISFIDLRAHLRRFTYAMIPISEKPVFFRYYDPRVFWNLTDILEDSQLHTFLGPISIVASYYKGELKQDHFTQRRSKSLSKSMRSVYLTLNKAQYSAFDQIYETAYIKELCDHMWRFIDSSLYDEDPIDSEKSHKEMLIYERDIKGVEITHPEDLALIYEGTPFFMKSFNSLLWVRIAPNSVITLDNVMSQKLLEIGREKVNEAEFHKVTEGAYQDYLLALIEKEEERLEEERKRQKEAEQPLTQKAFRDQIGQFASDFYWFCKKQEIIDDRSLKSLLEIFMKLKIYSMEHIPAEYLQLLHGRESGKERANRLFLMLIDQSIRGDNNG